VRLQLYRAVDDPARCERYLQCHLDLVRQFDMTSITSVGHDWFTNPNVYVMEMESLADGELLAGVRLQRADGRHDLPTERAGGPGVRDFVKDRLATGIGESCGAWVSRSLAKQGVLQLLGCTTFAVAEPLGVRLVLFSCGHYTLAAMHEIGCVLERSLGEEGTFTYPTPERTSYFMTVRDTHTCADATPEYRDLIFDLRRRLRQHRVLESPHAVLDVEVDLRLLS
jgi:hypothetical protein